MHSKGIPWSVIHVIVCIISQFLNAARRAGSGWLRRCLTIAVLCYCFFSAEIGWKQKQWSEGPGSKELVQILTMKRMTATSKTQRCRTEALGEAPSQDDNCPEYRAEMPGCQNVSFKSFFVDCRFTCAPGLPGRWGAAML